MKLPNDTKDIVVSLVFTLAFITLVIIAGTLV